MIMKIITEQLAEHLPQDHELKKQNIVNPTNFNHLYQLLISSKIDEIIVIDSTKNHKFKQGTILPIHDHINRTGTNILRGKQLFLGIDFIDITNIYAKNINGIITDCCGKNLNQNYEYPSHYICHITTLACAMNINNIQGFLYNTT